MYKKLISCLLLCMVIFAAHPATLNAETYAGLEDPVVDMARYVYLYSIDNDQVLFTKNLNDTFYPASFTKLITAILALEHYESKPESVITVKSEALKGVSGNNIGLKDGEILTADQLINALIVGNSNDAAHVLAFEISGSIEAFVTEMNNKAREIGAVNTNFTNPTGIHDNNMYTNLTDMAKIAIYAYKVSRFTDISSQAYYDIPATNVSKNARRITNRNYLVSKNITDMYYNSEALGLNAGSTPQAMNCLAAIVNHDGAAYLCIISGASDDDVDIYSYVEADKLFQWVYDNWSYVTVLKNIEMIAQLPVSLSSQTDNVTLYPLHEVEIFIPTKSDIDSDVERLITLYEEELTAPVESGVEYGNLALYYKGQLLGRVPLVTKNFVDRSPLLYAFESFKVIAAARWFKAACLALVSLSVLYVIITAIVRQRAKERRKKLQKNKKI